MEPTRKFNGEEMNKILNSLPIGEWPFPRVLVGILLERTISHADEVFFPFLHIAAQAPAMVKHPYGRTDVVRNNMATELLKSDYTHLLMLDLDHAHPENVIQLLSRWVLMDADKYEVIGGLNFRRSAPYEPCCFYTNEKGIFAPAEWDAGALLKVDAIGTGSILISRRVFERLEPPWFYNIYDDVWRNNWPGEDIGFSHKCRQNGIEMWVDTECTSPHITNGRVDESTFRRYAEKTGKIIYNPETMEPK